MQEPMNSKVMQAYRTRLGVNSAPSFIDSSSPVQPVSIIGADLGLSIPVEGQKIRAAHVNVSGVTAASYQIATASNTKKYFYLGLRFMTNASNNAQFAIIDGTTFSAFPTANTLYTDNYLAVGRIPATIDSIYDFINNFPVNIASGILFRYGGGTGCDAQVTIYYIEVDV